MIDAISYFIYSLYNITFTVYGVSVSLGTVVVTLPIVATVLFIFLEIIDRGC